MSAAKNRSALAVLSLAAITGAASASLTDATMYTVGDLSPFTNLVATLDLSTTAFGAGTLFTESGHTRSIAGTIIDQTELVSRVFEVTQQTQLAPGGLTLEVGDMVFAYTIRLVSESTSTVNSLSEFQVGGLSFIPGIDVMDASLIRGRGFVTPGSGVFGPLGANPGDLEDLGAFGSSLDWEWSNDPAFHLDNSQEITLLMFTSRSSIGDGVANLIAPPLQPEGVDPVLNGAPVLIPIAFIPSPGGAGVMALAALVAARRRR